VSNNNKSKDNPRVVSPAGVEKVFLVNIESPENTTKNGKRRRFKITGPCSLPPDVPPQLRWSTK